MKIRNLLAVLFSLLLLSGCSLNADKNTSPSEPNPEQSRQDKQQSEQPEAKEETIDATKEVNLSQEELEAYYASYKDPFVLHVRKALSGYLAGTNEGMSTPEAVIERDDSGENLSGLDSFDKEYYKSKFVLLSLDDSVAGGKQIYIIFQDKPDRIFGAWVYPMGDGTYDLRGFWESKKATEEIDSTLKIFGKYIFDKEHSL